MRTSGRPQGTTHSKGCRSLSTLTAKPCVVTSRERCTPIEAILRSAVQTPMKSRPSPERPRGAGTPSSTSAVTIACSIVRT